jgi:hypothetical protein
VPCCEYSFLRFRYASALMCICVWVLENLHFLQRHSELDDTILKLLIIRYFVPTTLPEVDLSVDDSDFADACVSGAGVIFGIASL